MGAQKHLLVVTHTPTDNTRRLAAAVVAGARHEDISGVEVRQVAPLEAGEDDVHWADAIILGTPANFGYMSGALKDFFDRVYPPLLDQTVGLPYALYVRGKTDAAGAQASVERIVTGLKWRAVQPALTCVGAWDEAFLGACEELGMTLAAGLELGIF